jgi:hypothetical protein
MPDGMVRFSEYSRQLDVPQRFKREHIQRAQKDCEILGEILRDKPDEAQSLLDDVLAGKIADAKKRAKELGLSEDNFISKGGGIFWIIVIVVVLYATEAY